MRRPIGAERPVDSARSPETKASADIPRGPAIAAATAQGRAGRARRATAATAARRAASPRTQADAAKARIPAFAEDPIVDAKKATAA